MKKKIVLLLATLMLMAAVPVFAESADNGNGGPDSNWCDGSGQGNGSGWHCSGGSCRRG